VNVFHAFPDLIARLGVDPRHLVHVGAHEGQEMPYYQAAGFRRITLVEPIPALAAQLAADWPDAEVVQVACAERAGRETLHLMRRSNMSTLAAPDHRDRITGSIPVDVRRLADVAPGANVAVVDAQGLELDVLRGANLELLDLAVVETCTVVDPTMADLYEHVVAFMAAAGFVEVDRWVRDYDRVHRWARGRASRRAGEIRDVIFARESNHAA
jgi:FkbM family methyltransferase